METHVTCDPIQSASPFKLSEHGTSSSPQEAVGTRELRTSITSNTGGYKTKLEKLMENNKNWAADRVAEDPEYFDRLLAQQTPEYFWVGCADSRVPANVIMGLAPGEVFTQRNVGNQATHTDMNVMSCLEYAVTGLKVKTIICCGHYGCGAVKAALSMPSKTQSLVNCWISDIRECRNQHHTELKALGTMDEQCDRLCELNVMRQTFHICTSPILQNAWDQGQDVSVFGVIYSLKDGLIRQLVGPFTKEDMCFDILEYERKFKAAQVALSRSNSIARPSKAASFKMSREPSGLKDIAENQTCEICTGLLETCICHRETDDSSGSPAGPHHEMDTLELASKMAQHVRWSGGYVEQDK